MGSLGVVMIAMTLRMVLTVVIKTVFLRGNLDDNVVTSPSNTLCFAVDVLIGK